jgi:NADPH:quinone reductase
MRAALARQLGGIDRVELAELPDPAPAAGQALVRVHGAGVGPWDVGFLSGGFPGLGLPFVPGQEVAGVVEAAGDGAGVQSGERVYAALFPAGGGFAELALASADRLAPMPGTANFVEAAVGARVVAVASPPNHDYLLSLGASEAFDYHPADWAQQVRAVVPGGVDLLFDGAGGQTRDQALDAVRDGGRAISIILQGTPLLPERGITGGSFAAHGGRRRLEQLGRLVDAGTLRPQVEAVLPLEQARQALARVAGRHTRGKVVLQVGQ